MSRRAPTHWLIAVVAIILAIFDDSPVRYVKLVVFLGLLFAVCIPRKRSQRIFAAAVTLVISFLLFGREVTLSIRADAASSAFWAAEAPAQRVFLGGQRIYFPSMGLLGTACFAPGDGTLVTLAHSAEQLTVSQSLAVNIHDQQNVISCHARVLMNTEQGVVLGLPPEVSIQAEQVALGGTADIRVGNEATVHSIIGGTFPMIVDGYIQKDGQQLLVLTPTQPGDKVIRGMSGSPVTQNGKLIGLVYAAVETMLQPGNFGLAKLAVDVFAASQALPDWSGVDRGNPGQAPSADLTEAVHQSLIKEYEIDLSRFARVENLDESPLPSGGYTPAFSDQQLRQVCVQDAQREYRSLSAYPPLVLFAEEDNLLLVGYALADERTVLLRYQIRGGGWQKSVVTR